MLIMSYIGDHVWLITSRQTEPDLTSFPVLACCNFPSSFFPLFHSNVPSSSSSSTGMCKGPLTARRCLGGICGS